MIAGAECAVQNSSPRLRRPHPGSSLVAAVILRLVAVGGSGHDGVGLEVGCNGLSSDCNDTAECVFGCPVSS